MAGAWKTAGVREDQRCDQEKPLQVLLVGFKLYNKSINWVFDLLKDCARARLRRAFSTSAEQEPPNYCDNQAGKCVLLKWPIWKIPWCLQKSDMKNSQHPAAPGLPESGRVIWTGASQSLISLLFSEIQQVLIIYSDDHWTDHLSRRWFKDFWNVIRLFEDYCAVSADNSQLKHPYRVDQTQQWPEIISCSSGPVKTTQVSWLSNKVKDHVWDEYFLCTLQSEQLRWDHETVPPLTMFNASAGKVVTRLERW